MVSSSLDLAEFMDNALDKVLSITDLDAGSIYLWNPEEELLTQSAYRGEAEEFANNVICFRLGESLIGHAAQLRAVIVYDLENDPRVTTHLVSKGKFKSFISIPICCRNQLIGTINLASRHCHFFSTKEIGFYTGILNIIGMAFYNGCLFARTRKMAKSLQESEERLRILAVEQQKTIDLFNRIGQAMNVKELAEIVTGDLKSWLDLEAVGIRI
ncbi:MAG: GAF domain-containing protein [Desulfatirhabdiaceae bacterium]